MVDLDSNPTKPIEVVEVAKRLLIACGSPSSSRFSA